MTQKDNEEMKSGKDGVAASWFFLLIFFLVWNFHFEIRNAVFSPLEAVILVLAGLTFLGNPLSRLKETVALRYLLPFAAFILPMIPARFLILDLGGSPVQTAWRIFRNLFELIPWIFLLILANVRKVRTLKALLVFLVIMAGLASVVGIVQTFSDGKYLTGIGVHGNFKYLGVFPPLSPDIYPLAWKVLGSQSIITHTPDAEAFRAHGSLTSHNTFGAFLIPTLCLTLGLAFMAERRKIVFALLAFPQVLAMILTFSRGVLAGVAIGLAVLLVLVKNRIRNLITVALLFIAVFSFLTVSRPDIMTVFVKRTVEFAHIKEAHGMAPRLSAWQISIDRSLRKPVLGHGTGALEDFTLSEVSLSSHNEFLDILHARGIIALAGWIILLVLILRDALAVFRKGAHPYLKAIGAGVFSGMLGLMVAGMTQTLLHVPDTAALIWLCFGLAAAAANVKPEPHDD